MKKIKLEIASLSYSQTQSGAYSLVLAESNGSRRLPIIIGGFEAQSIAIELEKMTTTRPMTHDLFREFAKAVKADFKEMVIYRFKEGIFFAKLVSLFEGKEIELDSRTSDAIAIAVRFDCPIYILESILDLAGVQLGDEHNPTDFITTQQTEPTPLKNNPLLALSTQELEQKLDEAVGNEDYEAASLIRDEINRRQE